MSNLLEVNRCPLTNLGVTLFRVHEQNRTHQAQASGVAAVAALLFLERSVSGSCGHILGTDRLSRILQEQQAPRTQTIIERRLA
jgi:hypothetical protein